MRFDIISPFPDMFSGFFQESMMRQAQLKKCVDIKVWDLRVFTEDKHRTVDDYPYGGGPGMIMKPDPIFYAVDRIREETPCSRPRILLMSPQGELYNQNTAKAFAEEQHVIIICGHYRGVDERVTEYLITDEISIGNYILTGGELPAAVIVDSVVRLLPGVLNDKDSADGDSISSGRLDHPHYTRPAEFRNMKVPEVLISGHHARIEQWRKEKALEKTIKRRPDLLNNDCIDI